MSAPKVEAMPVMSAPKVMVNLALAMFASLSLASAPLIYFLWMEPNRRIARSTGWAPVTCTVVRSSGGEGGYHHLFEYEFRGRKYRSGRSTFWPGAVPFRYKDGARVTGLMNPARPEEAVLRPDHRPPRWMMIAVWFWVAGAAYGFVAFLAVRLNRYPLRVDWESKRRLYYREM